jgi:hypothetical protein
MNRKRNGASMKNATPEGNRSRFFADTVFWRWNESVIGQFAWK